MTLPSRQALMGIAIGAICATAVAAIGPGMVMNAFADEQAAGFDTSKLVKYDGRDYRIDYADGVSTDPISSSTVKKIEAGRVSYVSIVTTSTGTYSTDALTSRNIKYPGIEVTDLTPRYNSFSTWSNGQWTRISSYNGHSFISLRNNQVRVSMGPGFLCVGGKGFSAC